MPELITVAQLAITKEITIVDVRKLPARSRSGLTMANAIWRAPFLAENWWHEFTGQEVVVFCVHGHEVSKAVAGFLNDQGIVARYLEGGFEAYREAGSAVVAVQDNE